MMGSDHRDEAMQMAFLEEALATREGWGVMVFVHMPFRDNPFNLTLSTHCILPLHPARTARMPFGPLRLSRSSGNSRRSYPSPHVRGPQGYADRDVPSTSFFNVAAKPSDDPEAARIGYLH